MDDNGGDEGCCGGASAMTFRLVVECPAWDGSVSWLPVGLLGDGTGASFAPSFLLKHSFMSLFISVGLFRSKMVRVSLWAENPV